MLMCVQVFVFLIRLVLMFSTVVRVCKCVWGLDLVWGGQVLTRPADPGGLLPQSSPCWWAGQVLCLLQLGWAAESPQCLPAGPADHRPAQKHRQEDKTACLNLNLHRTPCSAYSKQIFTQNSEAECYFNAPVSERWMKQTLICEVFAITNILITPSVCAVRLNVYDCTFTSMFHHCVFNQNFAVKPVRWANWFDLHKSS